MHCSLSLSLSKGATRLVFRRVQDPSSSLHEVCPDVTPSWRTKQHSSSLSFSLIHSFISSLARRDFSPHSAPMMLATLEISPVTPLALTLRHLSLRGKKQASTVSFVLLPSSASSWFSPNGREITTRFVILFTSVLENAQMSLMSFRLSVTELDLC